jgi:hypothetical protein
MPPGLVTDPYVSEDSNFVFMKTYDLIEGPSRQMTAKDFVKMSPSEREGMTEVTIVPARIGSRKRRNAWGTIMVKMGEPVYIFKTFQPKD